MLRKVPLIVILGSTGTGKTKLSIELAERFGGEIISADSMQVYANLNIATAKATKEERSRARHHLLDVATPTEPYSVLNFRNAALPIIEKLSAQLKCPIVVGGTNYYIEALLWDILINTETNEALKSTSTSTSSSTTTRSGNMTSNGISQNVPHYTDSEMLKMSSQSLYDHLRIIDPASANRMHPNNKRKIIRGIEIYQKTGKTLTSILEEQRRRPGANRLGGPLRYSHTILLWLRCKQEILNQRLDKRVDSMLEQGLLHEIRNFYNEHKLCDLSSGSIANATTDDNLYTKGVLQTIGLKEFIPYLEQFDASNDQKIEEYLRLNDFKMPTEEQFKANKNNKRRCSNKLDAKNQSSIVGPTETSPSPSPSLSTSTSTSMPLPISMELPPGLEQLNACLNELKLVTRRYSKKQIKWINNRFLASRDRQVPDLYELDTSDVSSWNENVYQRAVTIIENYRNFEVCEIQPMAKRQHPGADLNEETSHFCEICQRHFVGDFQFQLHMKSNKHKRRKETQRKREKLANGKKSEIKTTNEEKEVESDQSFPLH